MIKITIYEYFKVYIKLNIKIEIKFKNWQIKLNLGTLVNVLLPNYEKICFLEYANRNESKLIFGN